MKALAETLRVLLVVIALAAGATTWLFRWAPERVAAWDAGVVSDAARVEAPPAESIDAAARFLAKHRDVAREDRIHWTVRGARLAHVDALFDAGRTEEAVAEALEFAGEDSRDLGVRLRAGSAIVEHAKDPTPGLDLLRAAFLELPEQGVTTRTLVEALQRLGDDDEALDVALHHLAVSPRETLSSEGFSDAWLIYWRAANDEGFTEDRQAAARTFVSEQYVSITFLVPLDAVELRIDPPSRARIRADRVILALAANDQRLPFDMTQAIGTARDLEVSPTRFWVDGAEDPWFSITVPEVPANLPSPDVANGKQEGIEVRLVMGSLHVPRWIEDVVGSPDDAAFAAALDRLAAKGPAHGIIDAAAGVQRAKQVRARALENAGGPR